MKRFNSNKVRALGNLQSKSEKQKAYSRRLNGIKVRFSLDKEPPAIKKSRDYLCPVRADYVAPKPRGRSHVRMSHEKRLAILERHEAREKFFASL